MTKAWCMLRPDSFWKIRIMSRNGKVAPWNDTRKSKEWHNSLYLYLTDNTSTICALHMNYTLNKHHLIVSNPMTRHQSHWNVSPSEVVQIHHHVPWCYRPSLLCVSELLLKLITNWEVQENAKDMMHAGWVCSEATPADALLLLQRRFIICDCETLYLYLCGRLKHKA